MADRYWVGGTGTWDASTTTHWSATSNGAGGASAPTSIDTATFNSASSATLYTVTIATGATCSDLNASGPGSGNVTFTGAGTSNITGSFTLSATGITWTVTGTITFSSTITGKIITTNGITLTGTPFVFNGIGGGWTLGSALTMTAYPSSIIFTNGTFDTGGFSLTCWDLSFAAGIKTLNLRSSTLIAQTVNFSLTAGLTFNPGTSTISVIANNGNSNTGTGLTFYNFSFSNTSNSNQLNGMSGSGTFNNFTLIVQNGFNVQLSMDSNIKVNGTFTCNGTNTTTRGFIFAVTSGRPITITAAAVSLSNCDFRDIIFAGDAAPVSGTSLSDLKGNSGINFTTKTVYWNLAGDVNWSSGWALTSGGTSNVTNLPLAQDTCIFDDAGSVTGLITLDQSYNIGTLDMSARTLPMTLTTGAAITCYGNWIHGIGTKIITGGSLNFAGRNSQNISTLGTPITWATTIDSIGGTVNLLGALTVLSSFTLNNGNFNLNNYNLTASTFASSTSTIRSLQNCSNITLFGNAATIWNTNPTTNMIFTGIPNVNFVYARSLGTRTIDGTFFPANFNILAGNDSISTTSGYNFDFTGFSGVWNQSSSVIYGSIKCSNLMTILVGGGGLTLQAYTSFGAYVPTTCTLDTAGKTFEFAVTFSTQASYFLRNDLQLGPTRALTLNQGTLDLNGFNLSTGLFSSIVSTTRLLNIGNSSFILSGTNATIWNTSTSTNLSIFANNPISCTGNITTGTRTINAASAVPVDFNILAGTDTVTITGAHSVNYTGWRGTIGVSNINGNVIFGAGSLSTTNLLTLNATAGVKTITSNGNIINFPLTINGVGGSYVLQDALTLGNPSSSGGTFTLTAGTFDANDYNVTVFGFNATNANIRTLHIRSGTWSITGSGFIVWDILNSSNMTFSQHTGSIILTSSVSGSRIFNSGGFTYTKLIIGGNSASSTTSFNSNVTFLELGSTNKFAHTLIFQAGTSLTVKKWSITGSPGKIVTLSTSILGSTYSLNLLERVIDVDYLSIYAMVVSRSEFYAGRNSINVGLNSGPLYFTEAPIVPTTYYCVADGTWNLTNPTIWSLTSGGQPNAGVPTSIDNVIFDSTRTIIITTTLARCNNLTILWQAGTVTLGSAGTETLYIFGSLDNQIPTKLSPVAGLRMLCSPQFVSTETGNKINFNGSGPSGSIYFDGVGGTWQLTSFLDASSYGSATLFLVNGTLNTGDTPLFAGSFNSNYTTNRTLLLGISTINLTSATPWTINPLNFNYVALKII